MARLVGGGWRRASAPGSPAAAEAAVAARTAGSPFRGAGAWDWHFDTDPTLLMRFSAATANAHRIHYDWPYATRVEGCPGLVVHGPLMTLALAETLRLEGRAERVTRVGHRNNRPLFCGQPARLRGRRTADGFALDLLGPEAGTPCTSLTVTAR
ncbi:hypothetical protein ACFFV7_21050 [Nonomuraea spiralis]|uniref:Uncharacterized protein n=1 Tax=Nonomuraea spiralis TaxID=46182 RepID=A0ABV5IGN1_9ACTN|nr:hypothetical protein [Nonomuraea spiralis]